MATHPSDFSVGEKTKSGRPQRLTARQNQFCVAYHRNHGNASKAAKEVGCKPNSAHATASRWLKTPHILERIKELETRSLERAEITADWVKMQLKTIVEKGMEQEADKFSVECAIRALDSIARIGGFNAPNKSQSSMVVGLSDSTEGLSSMLDQMEDDINSSLRDF